MSIRLLAHRLPLAAIVVIAAWPQQAAAQRRTGQSYEELRNRMVDEDIVGSGISDPRVIRAMRDTPRHEFIHQDKSLGLAYVDMTLPIGEHQTITSPMLVAYMTEQLQPQADDRVLEIGTGSGYQAAVLSPLVKEVYTIEIVESLGKHARQTLKRLKYDNVFVKIGDGYLGWPDKAPFDKIIVTCSPEKVPQPLVDQLKEGGRMIVPVGERYQQVFHLLKKENGKLINEALRPTLFVPMTGEAEKIRKIQPDPLHPSLVNGGFEEIVGRARPDGLVYVRQMKVVTPPTPRGAELRDVLQHRAGPRLRGSAGLSNRRPQDPPVGAFLHGPGDGYGVGYRSCRPRNLRSSSSTTTAPPSARRRSGPGMAVSAGSG